MSSRSALYQRKAKEPSTPQSLYYGAQEVTREQHLRTVGHNRRSSSEGAVAGLQAFVSGSNGSSKIHSNKNRDRTHSSDSAHHHKTSRFTSSLSRLIKTVGGSNNKHQQLSSSYDENQHESLLNTPRTGVRRSRSDALSVSSSQFAADSVSVNSSVAMESIGNFTEASRDTVKVSNKSEKQEVILGGTGANNSPKDKKSKRWNKLKRMMGVKKTAPEESASKHLSSTPFKKISNSRTGSLPDIDSASSSRRGFRSDGSSAIASNVTGLSNISSSLLHNTMDTRTKNMVDDSIRGRLDGIDMLSLGPAQMLPQENKSKSSNNSKVKSFDMPSQTYSFSGKLLKTSPSRLVSNMIWKSGGRDPPEIILDGYCPGADGRWSVRVELTTKSSSAETPSKHINKNLVAPSTINQSVIRTPSPPSSPMRPGSPGPPPLQPSFASSDEFDPSSSLEENSASLIPSHVLKKTLWGTDPAPVDLTNLEDEEDKNQSRSNKNLDDSYSSGMDDPLLNLAAKCSIPIDIDEDTFIISSCDHIQAIHEIASSSIAKGRFAVALRVFETLLKGLNAMQESEMVPSGKENEQDEDNSALRFAKGATLHNIGILQTWLGQYSAAVQSFQLAVEERRNRLPKQHPDICVSLIRQSIAFFALNRLDQAKEALEEALPLIPPGHMIQAKMLNNLAVILFQQGNFNASSKELTKSLEIQRVWLDAPVRRPATVYNASITLCNMGKLYLERADFNLAFYLYEEALLLQTTIYRKDDQTVLETLTSLALAKARHGDAEKALQILQGCLRSQIPKYGHSSAAVMETVGLIGLLHTRMNNFDEALKCFTQARKWQKINLAPTHPSLKESKEFMKAIESYLNLSTCFTRSSSSASTMKSPSQPKVWV